MWWNDNSLSVACGGGMMNELEIYKDDSSRVLRQAEPEDLKVMITG
jgi:hypothetical protein